jgi:MFS family permease
VSHGADVSAGFERPVRLLLLTFLESAGTILLERGLYFYTHGLLAFSEPENLGLALLFGVVYVAGALLSHPLTLRLGEKRTLVLSLLGLLLTHCVLVSRPTAPFIVGAFPFVGFFQGLKWPIVETYISAGRTPAHVLRVLGLYNVSWATAVPLAVAGSGPIIASRFPELLFLVAAIFNVAALFLSRHLAAHPVHLDVDHPERPNVHDIRRYGQLLLSSRWSMLLSYSLLFLLAPLMPGIFGGLGLSVEQATLSASLLDIVRVLAFAVLGSYAAWHGQKAPLVLVVAGMPIGFLMILLGKSLWIVLFGEILFGAFAGLTYHAALYYALIVKNAAVDAGGVHEGLIGLGFALGPLVGLFGVRAAAWTGSYTAGMLVAALPLMLLCAAAGLRPLLTSVRPIQT